MVVDFEDALSASIRPRCYKNTSENAYDAIRSARGGRFWGCTQRIDTPSVLQKHVWKCLRTHPINGWTLPF